MSKTDASGSDRPASMKRLEAITGTSFSRASGELSVYIALDYSGSMRDGSKLQQAKDGAREFAENAFESGYAVGLVRFATAAIIALPPQRTIEDFGTALNRREPTGSTDMAAAIRLVAAEFRDFHGTKVMCLVTDGMPDHAGKTLAAARDAKAAGIDIMAIGTDDADRAFLSKLTTRSELAVTVKRREFHKAISGMALLLPSPR